MSGHRVYCKGNTHHYRDINYCENELYWQDHITVDMGRQTIMQNGIPVTVTTGLQNAFAWIDPITPYELYLTGRIR